MREFNHSLISCFSSLPHRFLQRKQVAAKAAAATTVATTVATNTDKIATKRLHKPLTAQRLRHARELTHMNMTPSMMMMNNKMDRVLDHLFIGSMLCLTPNNIRNANIKLIIDCTIEGCGGGCCGGGCCGGGCNGGGCCCGGCCCGGCCGDGCCVGAIVVLILMH